MAMYFHLIYRSLTFGLLCIDCFCLLAELYETINQ